MEEQKSRLIGGLLGIFLGQFGVHNFYLGYTTKAIIQVSLTGGGIVLGTLLMLISIPLTLVFVGIFVMFFGMFVMFGCLIGVRIWTLVEGIMIIAGAVPVDGKGIPLKE